MTATAPTPPVESIVAMEDLVITPEDFGYRESIETLALSGSTIRFSNGAPAHAAMIFDVFFRHAKKSVKIFCKNLSAQVFNSPTILESAKRAHRAGVNIAIVSQKRAEDSVFTRWLRSNPGVIFIEDAADKVDRVKRLHSNFAVMDGTAYRFEANADAINAVACMNDKVTAGKLDGLFALVLAAGR